MTARANAAGPRTAVFCALALSGFAANSLLCRAAMGAGVIGPLAFTGVRLLSGAAVLFAISAARGATSSKGGGFTGAAVLIGYAVPFSLAYVRIGAGVGALLLFATTQATMIGRGLLLGDKPAPREWAGLALALLGLCALVAPGLHAPDPLGAGLMVVAGLFWGIYSLLGRGAKDGLAANAATFIRCAPVAVLLVFAGLRTGGFSMRGLLLASASGAIASGLGYALWYTALPALTRTRAAVLQLAVPPLAAVGGALLLGEAPSLRLVVCGAAILAGIALAVVAPARA